MNGFLKYLTKEDKLHKSCIEFISYARPNALWLHSPNEGKRSYFEAWKFNYLGGGRTKGFPDLIIFEECVCDGVKYKGLVIEFKIKPNKTTPEQKQWLQDLANRGYKCCVCYDFDGFIKIIQNSFNGV